MIPEEDPALAVAVGKLDKVRPLEAGQPQQGLVVKLRRVEAG